MVVSAALAVAVAEAVKWKDMVIRKSVKTVVGLKTENGEDEITIG